MAKTKTAGETKATVCPITRETFLDKAKPVLIKIVYDGQEQSIVLGRKEFSTGSFGWTAGGEKATFVIGDEAVKVQLGINLTVVNSKEAK